MFRHDSMRSCSVATELPDQLVQKWQAAPGGRLTPPVAVSDRLYVGSTDANQVHCLDAATGKTIWTFVADGPVNSPPTWHEGRLLFGTRAGSLYALTARDGRMAWRFRAAPSAARLVAFGRLESPWPLDGSPLVLDGKVYCVAGRSMHLDSGLFAYAVDLNTGRFLQEANLQANTEPKGETAGSLLPDVLVSDGQAVYMKSMRFEPDDITRYRILSKPNRRGQAQSPEEILLCQTEMVDDSWLNCCFWAYRGCRAQQLVFDELACFGLNGPRKIRWGGAYGHDAYVPGSGFALRKWSFQDGKRQRKWRDVSVPLRADAMVLTTNRLYLAGIPDQASADDFRAAHENRRGGVLHVVSRQEARAVAESALAAAPVYNGLAAPGKRLFITTREGQVLCMGN
jgi:hypothetical protein